MTKVPAHQPMRDTNLSDGRQKCARKPLVTSPHHCDAEGVWESFVCQAPRSKAVHVVFVVVLGVQ
jgi:hypothetical protein